MTGAREALRDLGDWLRDDVTPVANPIDAAGEDKYRRAARMMQGTDLDPREAYGWAWDELHRLEEVSRPTLIYPYWHQRKTASARLSAADLTLLKPYLD